MTAGTVDEALKHFAKIPDQKLAALVSQVGAPTSLLDKIGSNSPFQAMARTIVYQQLSTKAGASIFRKLKAVCGGENCITPDIILSKSLEELRSAGLSARKAEYTQNLASHFLEYDLTKERMHDMTDQEVFDSLIQVKGIGEWSIHMFLMFSLGRQDILPVGDLVVRKGFKRLYQLNGGEDNHDTKITNLPDAHEMLELSEAWRPYRSIGTWLMWHAVESTSAAFTY